MIQLWQKAPLPTGLWDIAGFGGEELLWAFCLLCFKKRILCSNNPNTAVKSYCCSALDCCSRAFLCNRTISPREVKCFYYVKRSKESSYVKGVQLGGAIPVVTTDTELAARGWGSAAPDSFRAGTCMVKAAEQLSFLNEHLPSWTSAAVTMRLGKPTWSLGIVSHRLTGAPELLWSQTLGCCGSSQERAVEPGCGRCDPHPPSQQSWQQQIPSFCLYTCLATEHLSPHHLLHP